MVQSFRFSVIHYCQFLSSKKHCKDIIPCHICRSLSGENLVDFCVKQELASTDDSLPWIFFCQVRKVHQRIKRMVVWLGFYYVNICWLVWLASTWIKTKLNSCIFPVEKHTCSMAYWWWFDVFLIWWYKNNHKITWWVDIMTSWYDDMIIWSCDHMVTQWSFDVLMIGSYDHMIAWWFDFGMMIWLEDMNTNLITWWFDKQLEDNIWYCHSSGRNLRAAKHRFESIQKPTGRLVTLLNKVRKDNHFAFRIQKNRSFTFWLCNQTLNCLLGNQWHLCLRQMCLYLRYCTWSKCCWQWSIWLVNVLGKQPV